MARLSKEQEEILFLYTHEYMTVKAIANRRQKTQQAVYKILKKLKQKGLIGGVERGGLKQGVEFGGVAKQQDTSCQKNLIAKTKLLRLHNLQEDLKILPPIPVAYLERLKRSNKLSIDGFTVLLYKDNIQIYTQTQLSFVGYSTDECFLAAINDFARLYAKLENRLGVIIDKEGYLNHRWVRSHIAEVNNEIAMKANEDQERIVGIAEDGKEWLVTDRSFKQDELEFTHPQTNKQDADRVLKQLNSFRMHDPMTNTEIAARLSDTITAVERVVTAFENQTAIFNEQKVINAQNSQMLQKILEVLDR